MRAAILIAGLAFCAFQGAPALAQRPTGQRTYTSTTSLTPNRDVILEIPELSVDSIALTVADANAHIALNANAMTWFSPPWASMSESRRSSSASSVCWRRLISTSISTTWRGS